MAGSLQKLHIDTYSDSSYSNTSKISSSAFTALINPSSFSFTRKNDLVKDDAMGKSESNLKFNGPLPSELKLDFLFDGTGIATNLGNALLNKVSKVLGLTSAKQQLIDFYNATGNYDGTIHKPYNVEIIWGEFKYQGMLSEFTVDYKMFNNDGTPLRAVGKATFRGSISHELEALQAGRNSPDLTHKRTVKAGDTLPLMTQKIYGDSKYYLEVAKVNGLINFRELTPGQELFFPPIAKTS